MKYEFKYYETDLFGKETDSMIMSSFHADSLHSVLEKFELFLKGSGFHFEGCLDIVPHEDNSDQRSFDIDLGGDTDFIVGGGAPDPAHSPFYYETDRNKSFTAGSNDWDTSPSFNINLNDLNDNYEIKIDGSNIFGAYNNYNNYDTMIGNPHER